MYRRTHTLSTLVFQKGPVSIAAISSRDAKRKLAAKPDLADSELYQSYDDMVLDRSGAPTRVED